MREGKEGSGQGDSEEEREGDKGGDKGRRGVEEGNGRRGEGQ